MENRIPFNKPHLSGKETENIINSVNLGHISGDGLYTKKCHNFFEEYFGFRKCLLTTSCTDALEMAAILIDIKPGDEVIMPSYTFVSTSNAFILRGAHIVFVDCYDNNPNMNADRIESLISAKTKAIVPVHYAGIACDMDKIMALADKYKLFVIEDAAQAIDSYYTGKDGIKKPLGSIGNLSAFSFHETKNIISGEGGMLVINDERFINRAEIIREKGTNRSAFFRGEIDKYNWVDIGSSFLPSDIIAAFLYAQLEKLEKIQNRRKEIWQIYKEELNKISIKDKLKLPEIPDYATNNAHMFFVVCNSIKERDHLIQELKKNNINAVFHYQSLHKSAFYAEKHTNGELINSENFSNCLVRLPFYYDLSNEQIRFICARIKEIIE